MLPRKISQGFYPRFDLRQAHLERVLYRHFAAQHDGRGHFPVLKAPGIRCRYIRVSRCPMSAAHIRDGHFQACLQHPVRDVQKSAAAGSAQKLAQGGRQEIATDLLHVERELARRLTGIHQIPGALRPAKLADGGYRLHQSAVGGYVGDGHQPGLPFFKQVSKIFQFHPARCTVAGTDDAQTAVLFQGKKSDLVGHVVIFGGQNNVVGLKGNGAERPGISVGRAAGESNIPGMRAQQTGDRRVKSGYFAGFCIRGFVPANFGFQSEVVLHRVEHGLGRQAGARIIQVDALCAAGCFRTKLLKGHGIHPRLGTGL